MSARVFAPVAFGANAPYHVANAVGADDGGDGVWLEFAGRRASCQFGANSARAVDALRISAVDIRFSPGALRDLRLESRAIEDYDLGYATYLARARTPK
jgi:hypothetical protein